MDIYKGQESCDLRSSSERHFFTEKKKHKRETILVIVQFIWTFEIQLVTFDRQLICNVNI